MVWRWGQRLGVDFGPVNSAPVGRHFPPKKWASTSTVL